MKNYLWFSGFKYFSFQLCANELSGSYLQQLYENQKIHSRDSHADQVRHSFSYCFT